MFPKNSTIPLFPKVSAGYPFGREWLCNFLGLPPNTWRTLVPDIVINFLSTLTCIVKAL